MESQIHSDSSSIESKTKQVKKRKVLSKRKNNLKQSVNLRRSERLTKPPERLVYNLNSF